METDSLKTKNPVAGAVWSLNGADFSDEFFIRKTPNAGARMNPMISDCRKKMLFPERPGGFHCIQRPVLEVFENSIP